MSDYIVCGKCGCCYVTQHKCIADLEWVDMKRLGDTETKLKVAEQQIKLLRELMNEMIDINQKLLQII